MLAHSISKINKSIETSISNAYQTFLSLLKILILSKYKSKLPLSDQNECAILGNGPSLKKSLEIYHNEFKTKTLFCVNFFANTESFFLLKPANYVLLDPLFFKSEKRDDIKAIFSIFKTRVDWEMNLFVPYLYKNDAELSLLKNQNPSVKIYFFNYTVTKGFDSIIFKLFKLNLSMPQFFNVLGIPIFLSINMGFKKIWVFGADHSWFTEMYVGEDNVLYMDVKHFYSKQKKDEASSSNMGVFFDSMYKVFTSYYKLRKYAEYRKAKIYNSSEFSYIDAFERKKMTNN